MLKCHPITAFMKTHANFKKNFLIRVFWFKYIFTITFKIRILDLMLLPKNSVPFEGQYYSSGSKPSDSDNVQCDMSIAEDQRKDTASR